MQGGKESGENRGPRIGPGDDLPQGYVLAERYRIERRIGLGGMATVYEATQLPLRRRVAVKVLRTEGPDPARAVERFEREARVLAGLGHPNIVTVFDFGVFGVGRAFIAMEYLAGPTLAHWIATTERRDVLDVVQHIVPVCRALAALHRSGLVHCDVKPSNILLPPPGEPAERTKIVDLGLATGANAFSEHTGGTGTPEFMAPELFHGDPPSAHTDIYALGATAYEAFAGVLPYAGSSLQGVYRSKTQGCPASLTRYCRDFPAPLDNVIASALHSDPRRRPQTAEAFSRPFERMLDDHRRELPVTALEPSAETASTDDELDAVHAETAGS